MFSRVVALGELPFAQSFVCVPRLSLGGEDKVENLHPRGTIPAIQAAVDPQGMIGH